MEDWIKKLENYECDGQMELKDYLRENRKDEIYDEKVHIRADYGRGVCSIPENGNRTYSD